MKPWQYEGGTIHYSDEVLEKIYKNRAVRDFLQVGDHDHNFILVGAKGTGKTLLLNLKSLLFRESYAESGFSIYPRGRNQLTENLILDNNQLSKQDLINLPINHYGLRSGV